MNRDRDRAGLPGAEQRGEIRSPVADSYKHWFMRRDVPGEERISRTLGQRQQVARLRRLAARGLHGTIE